MQDFFVGRDRLGCLSGVDQFESLLRGGGGRGLRLGCPGVGISA